MKLSEIKAGEIYTYYPPTDRVDDNVHFKVLVDSITKTNRVRIIVNSEPKPKVRSVSAMRLVKQADLL